MPVVTRPGRNNEGYAPWFDWLRAVCACVVMWSHAGAIAWPQAGNFAVQVFFALSGWLIGSILLDLRSKDLPLFYFNRAVRIWIPYFLAGAFLLGLSVAREPVTEKWLEFVAYKATFVYNLFGAPQVGRFVEAMPQRGTLNHFWSVNAEEQFYLLAPLLLVLAVPRFGRSSLTWGALAFAALLFDAYAAIVLGVCAALIKHRFGPVHRTLPALAAIAAVSAACIGLLVAEAPYFLVAPILGLGVVLLLSAPGQQHRLGAVFGGMSYPLYLNHWIGLFAMQVLIKRGSGLGTLGKV